MNRGKCKLRSTKILKSTEETYKNRRMAKNPESILPLKQICSALSQEFCQTPSQKLIKHHFTEW